MDKELEKYLNFAKKYPGSVVLHVKTIKGKGYKFAEEDKTGLWHHVGPFNIETGELLNNSNIQVGTYLGDYLSGCNEQFKAITAAMTLGCGLSPLQLNKPNSIIDVGIAEENAVEIAAGLTTNGITPIVFIYSTFLQRAYDQILHDVTRTNKHVIFCLDRAGIVEGDGDTHQGIFDISYLMPLPNMTILAPSTNENAVSCLKYALKHDGPIAIRYPKYLPNGNSEFTPNKWIIEKELKDINVLTYGSDVEPIKTLLENYNVGLINAISIKPMDYELLNKLHTTCKLIIYEQINKTASIGEQIKLALNNKIEVIHITLPDTYLTEGNIEEIKKINKIDYLRIIEAIK